MFIGEVSKVNQLIINKWHNFYYKFEWSYLSSWYASSTLQQQGNGRSIASLDQQTGTTVIIISKDGG
jgi:hypothetical protein